MLLKRLFIWIFAIGLVCQPVMYLDSAQAGSCLGDCRRDVKICHNTHVMVLELTWQLDLALGPDSACLVCDLQPDLDDLKLDLDECGNDYLGCVDACLPDNGS